MRATNSASTFGMHHIFSCHGLSSISASRRRIVSAESVSCAVRRTISSASSCRVQRARPAGGFEHATATSSDFVAGVELARRTGRGRFAERAFQALLDEALLRPIDRRRADSDVARDRLVGRAGVGGEEDLRPLDPANRPLPAARQRLQLVPFSEVSVTR